MKRLLVLVKYKILVKYYLYAYQHTLLTNSTVQVIREQKENKTFNYFQYRNSQLKFLEGLKGL